MPIKAPVYTNIPGQPGTYTPDLPYWRDYEKDPVTRPEITMGEGRARIEAPSMGYVGSAEAFPKARGLMDPRTVEEIEASTERLRTERLRAPTMPTREQHRANAIRGLPGGDPYLRDVNKEARVLFQQRIEGLRSHIFKGIPRGAQLTAEQQQHLKGQAFKLYQMSITETATNIKTAKDALANMMSRFDKGEEEMKARELKAGELGRAEAKLRMQERVKKEFEKPAEEKPEYKPGQALEKIATAQRAKATFDRTKMMDVAMAQLFPEFKPLVGKKLSPKQVATVNKSYDRLINYLEKFTPTDSELPSGMPDPAVNKDRVIKDTETGKRYKSDGVTWSEF